MAKAGVCERANNEGSTRRHADVNAVVGGYLRDLAFVQPTQPQMFGYKRAAAVILALEASLIDLVEPNGRLPRIPGIGPASAHSGCVAAASAKAYRSPWTTTGR